MKFIYVAENPITGAYKVGITSDPIKRASGIANSSEPCIISKLFIGTAYDEKTLHHILKNYSIGGEWYLFPDDRRADFWKIINRYFRGKQSKEVAFLCDYITDRMHLSMNVKRKAKSRKTIIDAYQSVGITEQEAKALSEYYKSPKPNIARAEEVKAMMGKGMQCKDIVIALRHKYGRRMIVGDHATLSRIGEGLKSG